MWCHWLKWLFSIIFLMWFPMFGSNACINHSYHWTVRESEKYSIWFMLICQTLGMSKASSMAIAAADNSIWGTELVLHIPGSRCLDAIKCRFLCGPTTAYATKANALKDAYAKIAKAMSSLCLNPKLQGICMYWVCIWCIRYVPNFFFISLLTCLPQCPPSHHIACTTSFLFMGAKKYKGSNKLDMTHMVVLSMTWSGVSGL